MKIDATKILTVQEIRDVARDTLFQAGEASRVLHPPRCGASGCSAKGRSATRSDSQRSPSTNQVGWPSGLGMEAKALSRPTERCYQPTGGRQEKNSGASPDLG